MQYGEDWDHSWNQEAGDPPGSAVHPERPGPTTLTNDANQQLAFRQNSSAARRKRILSITELYDFETSLSRTNHRSRPQPATMAIKHNQQIQKNHFHKDW